ncbi:MAG: serine hydrolase [Pseudomonadota bacterium]
MSANSGSARQPKDPVHLGNWRQAPHCRWAFNHVREIVPAAPILRDRRAKRPLRDTSTALDGIRFTGHSSATLTAAQWLDQGAVDAVVALHGDRVVHEWYAAGQGPALPHILMSVSKSVLGLLAGAVLSETGTRADTPVVSVLPELAGSAWDGATLRQALDMQVSIRFEENYLATDGAIIEYRKAQGWNPLGPGEQPSDLRTFFPRLRAGEGEHGGPFHYVSPNTDMMAWALERVSGTRYNELLTSVLWQPMAAEEDAYITVDRLGAPRAAGGVCATARDLARLGLVVCQEGTLAGRQVLPADWVRDTLGGGDRDAFARGDFRDKLPGAPISYRNYCYWNACAEPYLFGVGIHGQAWVIDPQRALVVAVQSSHGDPQPDGAIANAIGFFSAVRDHLG